MNPRRKIGLQLLKFIGVVIFLWIILHIDRAKLMSEIKDVNLMLLLGAFLVVFLMYAAKAMRWHILVRSTGLRPTFMQSWHLYNIGLFFALITPGKLGELGRAAYLKKAGLHGGTAICIPIIDRLADVISIGIIAIVGIGILFGWMWTAIFTAIAITSSLITFAIWNTTQNVRSKFSWLSFLPEILKPKMLLKICLSTLLSWAIYFTWTILIARSLGMDTPIPILVSVYTITGILALIPIAPSGLGTRDAALVTLLAPYGIAAEQAVALALLMFTVIIASGIPGLWYWVMKPVEIRK